MSRLAAWQKIGCSTPRRPERKSGKFIIRMLKQASPSFSWLCRSVASGHALFLPGYRSPEKDACENKIQYTRVFL